MIRIYALLLFCWFRNTAYGQVSILPLFQENYFSMENLWQVNLVSYAAAPMTVQLQVTLEDAKHEVLLSATSPVFTLFHGSNQPRINAGLAQVQFGTNTAAAVLRTTGRVPYGSYIICYQVLDALNSAQLGEFCQERTILPFGPPALVYPSDGEQIQNPFPILSWRAPYPPGAFPFNYLLRLTEMKHGQQPLEALEENAPLLSREITQNTLLPYPGDAPSLDTGKIYAWQVIARAGDFDLGATEVWTFSIGSDLNKSVFVPDSTYWKSYLELNLTPNNGFTPIRHQKLKFVLNNRYGADKLKYQTAYDLTWWIYPEGNRTTPVSMTQLDVNLTNGVNKITLTLPDTALTDDDRYLLVIRDVTGKEYYLDFIYNND